MDVTSAPFLSTLLVSLSLANDSLSPTNNHSSTFASTPNTTMSPLTYLSLNGSHNLSAEDPPHIPAYLSIYVTVLNVIILMTGVVGNILVIVVVTTVRDMRTPMNWYLVNLSMADLLVLMVCQPAALTEFFARDRWFLGKIMCKAMPFLEHAVLHASTLIILAITVERFYAICMPMKKLAVCHRPRPLRVLPVLWSTAIVSSVPFVVMTRLVETTFIDGTPCFVCSTPVKEGWHVAFITGMTALFFVCPMLILFGLYACIITKLRSSGTTLRRVRCLDDWADDAAALSTHRSRKQIIKMLIGIVLLFFVSLTPLRIVIFWQIFTPSTQVSGLGPESYYNLMWLCRLLMYTNSAGNPIIYSLVSSKFRLAFTRLLHGDRMDPLVIPSTPGSRRHSSFSRFSVSGVHRHSAFTHSSSTRNSYCESPSMLNGSRRTGSVPAVVKHRAPSLSLAQWIAMKGRTNSCSVPLSKRQSSCNSML